VTRHAVTSVERDFHERMHAAHMYGLWEHANLSAEGDAILFSIQDRPVLEALGLYREESLVDGDGHQPVTSTWSA
jgi:gentisate 1,2-dioxygenase